MNLHWALGKYFKAPLYGCKSLLRVNLKGCTKLTQLFGNLPNFVLKTEERGGHKYKCMKVKTPVGQ